MWLPCISSDLFPSLPRLHAVYKRFFNHSTINTACTSQIKVSLHNFRPCFLHVEGMAYKTKNVWFHMGHPKFADSTCKCVANQCAQASYKVLGMHWVQGYDWRDWHAWESCSVYIVSDSCYGCSTFWVYRRITYWFHVWSKFNFVSHMHVMLAS